MFGLLQDIRLLKSSPWETGPVYDALFPSSLTHIKWDIPQIWTRVTPNFPYFGPYNLGSLLPRSLRNWTWENFSGPEWIIVIFVS